MPLSCFVEIKGAKQGQFKVIDASGHSGTLIPCIHFNYSVTSIRNSASGQATSRRHYSPVFFTKDWDGASPQILIALATGEVLSEVRFQFVKSDRGGREYVYEEVALTDATIIQAKQTVGAAEPGAPSSFLPIDEISLAFRKIEVRNKDANTVFIDDSPGPM